MTERLFGGGVQKELAAPAPELRQKGGELGQTLWRLEPWKLRWMGADKSPRKS
jgi:hypothetical protein